ncbi:hypothetical protein E2C01_069539 [Portunus trituberculatus]|uniref:Uncharacterized protein n=1 Tax=Portunus trituberculatus TaxID=210409 RepID=A0A5B7HZ56_PORTR|nr:hypothetical protein [Portunus trituberculatus]
MCGPGRDEIGQGRAGVVPEVTRVIDKWTPLTAAGMPGMSAALLKDRAHHSLHMAAPPCLGSSERARGHEGASFTTDDG